MATGSAVDRVAALEKECAELRLWIRRLSIGLVVAIGLGLWGAYGASDAAALRANRTPVFREIGLVAGEYPVYLKYDDERGIVVKDALGSPIGRLAIEP